MMKRMVDHAYEAGIPQFGSCWGVQIAVYVAGGDVKANPKGREMGVARKVFLTEAGRCHPMYEGKAPVFDGLVSHDDEITRLPECATLLASNDFTSVQAVEVKYKNGIFWATQYHTEYDIHEIARLILAREQKLTKQGFFQSHEDLIRLVNELETLFTNPSRKDLRWRLAIDDDLLCDHIRQLEFVNWLKYFNFVKRTA
jgi:GMP synthase (glutamine-hydrolysing)